MANPHYRLISFPGFGFRVIIIVIGDPPRQLVVFLLVASQPEEGAAICTKIAGEELLGGAAAPAKLIESILVNLYRSSCGCDRSIWPY